MPRPFHLASWIDENRHLLKPPVGNQTIYQHNEDFIVMVVGGPNARTDFHYNEGEELFYQLEGDVAVDLIEEGRIVRQPIRQGEMMLLPPRTPHRPVRGPHTVGLVIERYRRSGEQDGFLWFCENCGNKLHEEFAEITDIVSQLPPIMARFNQSLALRTCSQCGTVAPLPTPRT